MTGVTLKKEKLLNLSCSSEGSNFVCKRKQRFGVMTVLAESRVPHHIHLLVNISCSTPIRAAEDFNVCLHICSPLPDPGWFLRPTQGENKNDSHWPTISALLKKKTFPPPAVLNATQKY